MSSYAPRRTYYKKQSGTRSATAASKTNAAPPAEYPKYRRKAYPKKRYTSSTGISRVIGQYGGAALGGYLGGPPGAAIGSAIGAKAGDYFGSITGIGDYTVSYNTIVNPNQTPMFKQRGRSVVISHREYITDVITSPVAGGFKVDSFDLNPALASTYPWLATIAQNFEQYRIHGMVFNYKSNSADALNSVNTALGTVIMATQYNVLLPEFSNKQQMENYEFGCSSRPSASLLHPIECDPKVTSLGPILDIKLGGNDKGDPRIYTPGRFSIATVGQQGVSVNIGELWVTYEVEFFKPRMGDTTSQMSQWRSISPAGNNFSAANLFYFAELVVSESSDFDAVAITQNVITFSTGFTGNVQVTMIWAGNSAGLQGPTATVAGGVSVLNLLAQGGNSFSTPAMGATAAQQICFTAYYSVVSGGSITFAGGVYTTVTTLDMMINTIPNTIELYVEEDDL